jgi:Cys-tRNA(Pro)/Cys-tRNA(Cys) deacylase
VARQVLSVSDRERQTGAVAKKSKHHPHGATPATTALIDAGIAFTVHPYEHHDDNTNFGEEAAAAIGVDANRIFKTLVADVGGRLVVAVIPVARQLDLKALATAYGSKKAIMADPVVAARSSGYVVGGISPIGQRHPLPTVLDASADDFDTVYVSAGRRGLQVELAPADLRAVTGATTAPIAH